MCLSPLSHCVTMEPATLRQCYLSPRSCPGITWAAGDRVACSSDVWLVRAGGGPLLQGYLTGEEMRQYSKPTPVARCTRKCIYSHLRFTRAFHWRLLAASSAVSHGVIGTRLATISEALQVEAPWRAGVNGGGSPWCFGYNTLTVAAKPIELCFGAEPESCFTSLPSVLPVPSKSGKCL